MCVLFTGPFQNLLVLACHWEFSKLRGTHWLLPVCKKKKKRSIEPSIIISLMTGSCYTFWFQLSILSFLNFIYLYPLTFFYIGYQEWTVMPSWKERLTLSSWFVSDNQMNIIENCFSLFWIRTGVLVERNVWTAGTSLWLLLAAACDLNVCQIWGQVGSPSLGCLWFLGRDA